MNTEQLQVDRIQEKTKALGPGCRAVVWFHGCSRGCPGCIAAEMNRSEEFESCTPQQLADRICALEGIEGITLSGGEPMDQPAGALAEFLRQIRARTGLSVMVYTGYLLDELKPMPGKPEILGMIDILVDGPYRQDWTMAARYYRLAAKQGHAVAQYNLGCCYEKGEGVEKDLKEAVEWFRKAAEQGVEQAEVALKRLGAE